MIFKFKKHNNENNQIIIISLKELKIQKVIKLVVIDLLIHILN